MMTEMEFARLGCLLTLKQFVMATGLERHVVLKLRAQRLLAQFKVDPRGRKGYYYRTDAAKLRQGIALARIPDGSAVEKQARKKVAP